MGQEKGDTVGSHFAKAGFWTDTEGSATAWSIFWTIIFLVMAGLAIDMSNAYRYRAALQATADSSSIGAMMAYHEYEVYEDYMGGSRLHLPSFRGQETAKHLATQNMLTSRNGTVMSNNQITWGHWNDTTDVFTPAISAGVTTVGPVNAVRVQALRTSDNNNAVPTLLLNMFGGLQSWNVGATSIAEAYFADCFTSQGIFAMGTLNFASNNDFVDETCYHGEQGVDMQNHNTFGPDTIVSAPDDSFLSGPSDFANVLASNPGLEGAWTNMEYHSLGPIRDFERIVAAVSQNMDDNSIVGIDPETGVAFLQEDLDFFTPDFLKVDTLVDSDNDGETDLVANALNLQGRVTVYNNMNQFTQAIDGSTGGGNDGGNNGGGNNTEPDPSTIPVQPLLPGTIHIVNTCSGSGGQPIRMRDNQIFERVAIITNCKVHLSSNVRLSRSLLITTNGKAKDDYVEGDPQFIGSAAITASSGVQIGDGTCADDNGSVVMAVGGANFSSGLGFMRSQIVVKGDIDIAANTAGLNGTSIISGGDVKLTSNGAVGTCPDQGGKEAYVYYDYRIVQ